MRPTLRYRWAILAAVWLPALTAHAVSYYYSGPNTVNVAGSACRAVTSNSEASLYHDVGSTTVRTGTQRLLCPIPRRGTSTYGGRRENGTGPGEVNNTQLHVNMSAVDVSGIDSSSTDTFRCFTFGANLANQTVTWGTPKVLCSQSTLGCSSNGASWTGSNTMRLAPPANFSGVDTVNFGVICELGRLSSLDWLEATITPN